MAAFTRRLLPYEPHIRLKSNHSSGINTKIKKILFSNIKIFFRNFPIQKRMCVNGFQIPREILKWTIKIWKLKKPHRLNYNHLMRSGREIPLAVSCQRVANFMAVVASKSCRTVLFWCCVFLNFSHICKLKKKKSFTLSKLTEQHKNETNCTI